MDLKNTLSAGRLAVIENIATAESEGDFFRKVEPNDPTPSREDIKREIVPFDNGRRSPIAKIKAFIARLIAQRLTKEVNGDTVIVGIENALSVKGSAMITASHYHPTDSTPIRLLAYAMGKRKRLHIIVRENNFFMKGLFGFLMRNCQTHPVSSSASYMAKNLRPALKDIVAKDSLILIYPEEQMWWNYKKPRPLRDGAYHYAAEFGIPIIPTFTELVTLEGERDADGLLPVKHILHVMPPIYPDKSLPARMDRERMKRIDEQGRKRLYQEVYSEDIPTDFSPERDIAGIIPDGPS